ncbi:MAG: hypothetical protein HN337_01220, partial [Deltaproteobacteria bacterium]|nr:hypothetical protein [Deltaproteobacteria bacterium]
MSYNGEPVVDKIGRETLQRLTHSAAFQQLDPNKEYDVVDADVLWNYKFSYIPSTLYLDVFMMGESKVDGTTSQVGIRTPLAGGSLDKISLYYGKGAFSVGLPILNPIPYVGIGNIYFQPGSGISLGWFSLTKAPDPYMILAGTAMVVLQTLLGGCGEAEECTLELSSNLVQSALPINTLREIIQKLGIDTSEHACDRIEDQNWMDRCLLYSTSYKKQRLFEVAHDMVDSGLESLFLDPYVRSILLAEHDNVRSDELRDGICIGSRSDIARNIKATTDEVEEFVSTHKVWLEKGEGERPPQKEIDRFMGNSLYLLQKLQVSATVNGERIKIGSGAPIAFKTAEDLARFIETTAHAYNTISESPLLWGNIAGKIMWSIDALTNEIALRCPESMINQWFKYKNLRSWINEVTSPNVHALFKLRKIHLLSILKKDFKGGQKDSYIERVRSAKLVDAKKIEHLRSNAMRIASQKKEEIDFIAASAHIYQGLELLLRLSYEDDPLAEVIGLDFTKVNDTPPMAKGFQVLYQLESAKIKGDIKYTEALGEKMDRLVERMMQYHLDEMKDEIQDYEGEYREKCKELLESFDDLCEILRDLNDGEDDSPALKALRKELVPLALQDGVVDGKS